MSTSKEKSVIRFCARSARPCWTISSPGNDLSRGSFVMGVSCQKVLHFFLELSRVDSGVADKVRFDLRKPASELVSAYIAAADKADDVFKVLLVTPFQFGQRL